LHFLIVSKKNASRVVLKSGYYFDFTSFTERINFGALSLLSDMEKIVKIIHLKDKGNDFLYWQTKTPIERLAAIETLRQQYFYLTNNVQPRFSPVCRIFNRGKG
jgi:hypothetical protein